MDKNKKYKILEKSEPKDSVITLSIELDETFVSSHRDSSIRDLKEEVEIDGFRKGHAPDAMIIERVGELKILEKNLFKTINTLFPIILADEKLNALTMPNITITKLAPNVNPEIKMEVVLFPEVELGDYKKSAKEIKKVDDKEFEATEKELEDYIQFLKENRARMEAKKNPASPEATQDKAEALELNDEFVKSLGEFKDVEDFKTKIKENISHDKKLHAEQKRRIEIIEKVIASSKVDVPQILVEEEQERMLMEFKEKVQGFKMNFEEYLTTIKKSEDDLKSEWKVDAEKRVKMNLVLPKIAIVENLKPDEEQINHEVSHILEHHKTADPEIVRTYVANILINQKVFEFLENL